jgi:YaiO family outer membrane protein
MFDQALPRLLATAIVGAVFAHPATAQPSRHSAKVEAETEDFSDGRGSRHFARLEYQFLEPDTTVLASPVIGFRKTGATSETALGGGLTVYQKWSSGISTRTHLFVSEDKPVFAQLDVAQDVTAKVLQNTTVTAGGRYAQFFGGRDVWFLSAGVRYYFPIGSVAYRLSHVDPEGQRSFLAHLVNVSLKDPGGKGETRLWLGAGEASMTEGQVDENFRAKNLGAAIQRIQPLTGSLALTLLAGVSSYEVPSGNITSTKFGIGLTTSLGGSVDRLGR